MNVHPHYHTANINQEILEMITEKSKIMVKTHPSNSITNLIKYTGTLLAISLSDLIWLLNVTILAIHLPRDLQLKEF